MKILTIFTLVLCLIILSPSVFANDETIMGTNTTLWSDVLNGANYYSATSANITIYNEKAITVVNNQPMTLLSTGRYYYRFVPNSTGIFYTFTQYSNTTSLVATASSTFYVADGSNMEDSIIFGLAFFIAFLLAFGVYLMSRQNQAAVFGNYMQAFKIGDFGFILIMLSVLTLNTIPAALLAMSAGENYYSILQVVWQISIVVTILTTVICTLFYIFLRTMMQSLEQVNTQKGAFRGNK